MHAVLINQIVDILHLTINYLQIMAEIDLVIVETVVTG